jgi:hypothetical protein
MRQPLRRQIRLLQIYTGVTTLVLVLIVAAAFAQATGQPQKFDELTVQRLNVVDADGTLRFVLANKDRMHPGVMDGVTINRPRPVAGMLFFNDQGDEVGGLTFSGQERDGQRRAGAQLAFDQLKQDQTVAISYSEQDGQRTAGLQVWDRADTRLTELIRQLNDANTIADAAARDEAVKKIRASAPPGPRRVFVGKGADKAAVVTLADATGQPRLALKVEADGNASIEFLDEKGKAVRRLTASGVLQP